MMLLLSLAAVTLVGSAHPEPPAVEIGTSTAVAPVPSDSLRGRVTDSTGTPLSDAQVTLVELARVASTDSNGTFVLVNVPAGRYTIVARRIGYVPASRTIVLGTGDRAVVDLRLPLVMGDLEPVVVTATRDAIDVGQSPLPVSQLAGDRLHREQSVSIAGAI